MDILIELIILGLIAYMLLGISIVVGSVIFDILEPIYKVINMTYSHIKLLPKKLFAWLCSLIRQHTSK